MSMGSAISGPANLSSCSQPGALGESQLFSAVGIYKGALVALRRIAGTKVHIDRARQLHLKRVS